MDPGTTRRLLERIARRVDTETGLRNRLARELIPADADMDDVASCISHEIRTPLASIRGNLEILTDLPGAIAPQYAGNVDAVTRNADRLVRTVDNLLRVFDQHLHEPADGQRLVDLRSVVLAAAEASGQGGERVHVEVPAEPVRVLADARLLEVAIGHLLSNALSFGGPGQPVTVRLAGGPQPSLEIRDQGPGLDEAELSRLGTPFFRGREARLRETPGLGLGVAIGRRIIEAHGGALHLRSVPGAGLTAHVAFPAVLAP
jgi:signal transduction histidine kinase